MSTPDIATPSRRRVPSGRQPAERQPTEADKRALANALAAMLAPLVIRDVASEQDTAATTEG